MYELPYDVNTYPNSAWVSVAPSPAVGKGGSPAGATPNGCGTDSSQTTTITTSAPSSNGCTAVSFANTAASCHANGFFEGLKDKNGVAYSKSTSYAVPDPAFTNYFATNSAYKFFEWNSTSPGGTSYTPGSFTCSGTTGSTASCTYSGTINNYCNSLSNTTGSGGRGGSGSGSAWSMTQRQRCQQCLDEAGYYIAPNASATDSASGNIIFRGNWLNFDPPKFIIARKVVTDFIAAQSSTPTPVRIGVVSYDNSNCSYTDQPGVSTGFTGRHDGGQFVSNGMIPDCNVTTWASSTTAQANLISAVRGISWGTTSSPVCTPLAETLFNVGQFYGGNNAYYTSTFGSQWLKTTGGAMGTGFTAPNGTVTSCPGGAGCNMPLCVSCQVNAIVLITDGVPEGDNNLPQVFRNDTIECPGGTAAPPTGCGTDALNSTKNLLDDVTNYLATNDISTLQTGIQDVVTFVIGLGLKVPLLDNAAKYGKSSSSVRADNAQDLQDDITNAVVNIVARATAFSSTAIQTLEVGTGSTAFVPRFVPSSPSDAIWEGHLFRFDLFNEFVAGVDLNGDGNLNGVFLVDRDGDIVTEDDKGAFHKQKNNAPAVPIWDAGDTCVTGGTNCPTTPGVSHLGAPGMYANRTIYTAVFDSTSSTWQTIPFTDTITDPNFAKIESYMGLTGTTACTQIAARMACPNATYLSSCGPNTFIDTDHCAKAIIDYVKGYNIANELTTTTAVNVNRAHMLGDIFHSSPVVVDPPVDQFICSLGLHSQCLSTLYQYEFKPAVGFTPSATYTTTNPAQNGAYEKFWEDHESRQKIVLVGANDGLIHAFDAGTPTTSPPTLNANTGFRQVVYGSGTGNEVWAFVPPDQLPRLFRMLTDGHQLYMDGDIMVRDVWVDGKYNDKGSGAFVNQPLVKQDVEYHTVAVASERQGGHHVLALDVTDTTTPKMLWTWPPPCSTEELVWGETFGQFSPRPPPIGPVLLQTSNSAGQPNYGVDHTEERWAVFLNGGHSPYNTRGRGAALLDVYTGAPLFEALYNPTATDPSAQMRFGFAATAAMVDYGVSNSFVPDGFFDTAILGDEGGQLWTFRFAAPGHINGTTGLVDNWAFGRAFEPASQAPNDTRYHNPIYTVASTTVETDNGWLRAYVGSGDRSHVRSQNGGDCRPDDPMTCMKSGCTLNSTLTLDTGPNHVVSSFLSGSPTSAGSPVMANPTQTSSTTSNACNQITARESVTVSSCPTSAMNFTDTLQYSCTGTTYSCVDGTFPAPTPDLNRNYTTAPPTPTAAANEFTSVAILADATGCAGSTRRMNATADENGYDSGRLSLVNASCPSNGSDLVDVTSTTATTTSVTGNQAGRTSAGWYIHYPTIDEKTVTSSTILGGCVIWSTLIPSGGAVGCASAGSTVAPFYQADVVTGAPNCAASFLSGNSYVRFIQRNVLSPPPEPAAAVAVGSGGGSLRFSTLEIQPGASEVTQMTVGTSTEMLQMLYSLPLSVDQHVCRHVDQTKCE
ncbi:MAG TPA: hypothetical protein VLW85_15870 [Myxococcales bacterium]|nr:hypothetical protein [Myxococcales bacterium]